MNIEKITLKYSISSKTHLQLKKLYNKNKTSIYILSDIIIHFIRLQCYDLNYFSRSRVLLHKLKEVLILKRIF